ncbi:MAG TPA: acetate kinase, partial [Burkholderiales bacterium]|nr:acetate kinase [Burkholderiales bacterium]
MNDSAVLALNSGSSSLKFGLYHCGPVVPEAVVVGEAQAIGKDSAEFRVRDAAGSQLIAERGAIRTQEDAVRRVEALLAGGVFPSPSAVGHRIVHGGPRLVSHCLVDGEAMRELEAAAAL